MSFSDNCNVRGYFCVLIGLSVPAVPGALGPLTLTSSAVTGRMGIPGTSGMPGNSVLLVTNLNPDVS